MNHSINIYSSTHLFQIFLLFSYPRNHYPHRYKLDVIFYRLFIILYVENSKYKEIHSDIYHEETLSSAIQITQKSGENIVVWVLSIIFKIFHELLLLIFYEKVLPKCWLELWKYSWNYELFLYSYSFLKLHMPSQIIWKRIIFFIFKLYILLDFKFFHILSNHLGSEKLSMWFYIIFLIINLSNVQKHSQFIIYEGNSNQVKIGFQALFETRYVKLFYEYIRF